VLVRVEGDRITAVTTGLPDPPVGAERLSGLALPGLVDAHSHAFQRALRGRTQAGRGSFWTWREQMYALAGMLDPGGLQALARATFGEMALAGITLAGEFHYLHHGPGGAPYDDPNEMGAALVAAAAEAGLRLTLIDACYLRGGVGGEPAGVQLRFCDRDVEAWAARVDRLGDGPTVRVAAAVHSVRAVAPADTAAVAGWAASRRRPLHAHVSEQPAENEACLAAYGRTPAAVLEEAGALTPEFTAVHATHLADADVGRLGRARVTCCLCPTTERDLADGIGPARRLRDAGARLAVGSDSNALVDLLEEARAVELDERLATGLRGGLGATGLLRAATAGGAESLGWPDAGRIAAGALADIAVVELGTVRLAGTRPADAVAALVFAGAAADVRHVMCGGRWIVRDGAHVLLDVARELREAVGRLEQPA